jgi:hypothetical protein
MSGRAWTLIGAMSTVATLTLGLLYFLGFLAVCTYVIAAAAIDIWHSFPEGPGWEKIALLLIFLWTILSRWKVRHLDEKIEQLRMTLFATASYFDFVYGNERLDALRGLGPLTKHGVWKAWVRITGGAEFADDVLMASFAKRAGRKVTFADDLGSMTSVDPR